MNSIGLYGKLPAHKALLSCNLPETFTQAWSQWLQRGFKASQERLGTQWLDVYLTSPVWRFVLSAGVIDTQVWCGVMIPSVDQAGYYRPFTLVASMAPQTLATGCFIEMEDWFKCLEAIALSGLEPGVQVAALEQQIQSLSVPDIDTVRAVNWEQGQPLAMTFSSEARSPAAVYPDLLHSLLLQRLGCYSLWWTEGSARVEPVQLISGYLPSPQCYTSLLAGDWAESGWSEFASPIPK